MESYKKLQEDLIEKTRRFHPVSEEVEQAFYHYPRHKFVPAQYSLTDAYLDTPLHLYHNRSQQSTISQPSFVLYLLELLQIKKGQKVFEVGTGSGWNAALISELVGDQGLVVSMEIIPEVANTAKETLQDLGVHNVHVIAGDASNGWANEAPYDRIIFTAAAATPPEFMFTQLNEGGRVLFVQEGDYGVDEIQVLEKNQGEFKCVQKVPCHFVPMTGLARDAPSRSPS